MEVKIKKLNEFAKTPTYGTAESAGFDMYASEDVIIKPNETKAVGTGLMFEVPDGHALFIFARSGVSAKTPLILKNCVGIVDSDYRGEVQILLNNSADKNGHPEPSYMLTDGNYIDDWTLGFHEHNSVRIVKGDRIAQGIVLPVGEQVAFIEGTPTKTARGKGGLGSTGK